MKYHLEVRVCHHMYLTGGWNVLPTCQILFWVWLESKSCDSVQHLRCCSRHATSAIPVVLQVWLAWSPWVTGLGLCWGLGPWWNLLADLVLLFSVFIIILLFLLCPKCVLILFSYSYFVAYHHCGGGQCVSSEQLSSQKSWLWLCVLTQMERLNGPLRLKFLY